jgi:23S rRNA pseudouridine1911/1915/1917 synthase
METADTVLTFQYDDEEEVRLDLYLSRLLEATSRTYLQKLIKEGRVTVNGKVVKVKKEKLEYGDEITLDLPLTEPLDMLAENLPLEIVYEDDQLLVVNKASGMVVHPAPGSYNGTLVNALLFHCGDRLSGINGIARPGIVHRLDKDTSGLMMIAKTDLAHQALAQELKDKKSIRRYMALVLGVIPNDEGTIDAPIGRDPRNRLRMAVVPGGKPAVTHFAVIRRFKSYTLIECRLETGRTHQIRVHLKSIGYPIAGDPLYGIKTSLFKLEGQMLHAKTLGFTHPVTHELMIFDSELPATFKAALELIERRDSSGI